MNQWNEAERDGSSDQWDARLLGRDAKDEVRHARFGDWRKDVMR